MSCIRLRALALGLVALSSCPLVAQTIGFVQANSTTPQTAQSSVSLPYASAQAAGDLNVVIIGWNDTATAVTSVTDTTGNVYALAAGPTTASNLLSQSIYYAKNIGAASASANTVTVQFSAAAGAPDVRIVEYSGLDLSNPLDAVQAGSGSSSTSSAGPVTTSSATDLIVAANTVFTLTTGAGAGFTSRLITSPDGDIVEDQTTTAAGSYSATASLSSSGAWVMQVVAFRAASVQSNLTTQNSCDLNNDGTVNVVDVQLLANMEINASGFPCSANVGGVLGCSESARQVVIKSALGLGCHFVQLNWGASPSSGVVGYNVYRGTTAGGETSTPINSGGPVTGTSFTDTTAAGGTKYYYVVKATNGSSESTPSVEASTTAQ